MIRKIATAFLAAAAAAGLTASFASPASAGAIFVDNPGFELPVATPIVPGVADGWEVFNGGVYASGFGGFIAPAGNQLGYTGSSYGLLIQNVGPVIGGASYELSVDVVEPSSSPTVDYRILLGWGGHDLATTNVFASVADIAIAPGSFQLIQLSGMAPVGANGPLLIFLENSNAFGIATQTGWDNVQLSVPEPAAWALMIVCLSGLGFVMRSRRRSANATA